MKWTELGQRDLVDTVQHASSAICHTVGFQTHFPSTRRWSKMDNCFKLLCGVGSCLCPELKASYTVLLVQYALSANCLLLELKASYTLLLVQYALSANCLLLELKASCTLLLVQYALSANCLFLELNSSCIFSRLFAESSTSNA